MSTTTPEATPDPRPVAVAASSLAPPPASLLPPLDVRKLQYGEMIRTLYLGRFDQIPISDPREITVITEKGALARKLFASYVEAFSDRCPDSLSAAKVQIQRTLTTRHQRVNGLGTVLDEYSVEGPTTDTGIYVEPVFGQAYVAIANSGGLEAIAAILRDMAAGRADSFGGAGLKHIRDLLEMGAEVREVIDRHGCESAQVKRFAANALAYVRLESPPHRFDGFTHYCSSKLPEYVPGTNRAACACVRSAMRSALDLEAFYRLEDDFTEVHFMKSVVARVKLQDKVAACIR